MRRRLSGARTTWSIFGLGVVSSVVGGLIVYLLVRDLRVT